MKKVMLILCIGFLFSPGCDLFNREDNNDNGNNNEELESVVVPGIKAIDYKEEVLYYIFDEDVEKLEEGITELTEDLPDGVVVPGGFIKNYYFGIEPKFQTLEISLDSNNLKEVIEWYKNELEKNNWELTSYDNQGFSFLKAEKEDSALEVYVDLVENSFISFNLTVGEILE